jgi:hypothetical protein
VIGGELMQQSYLGGVPARALCGVWILVAATQVACTEEPPPLTLDRNSRDSGEPVDRDPTDGGSVTAPVQLMQDAGAASCDELDCGLHGDCVAAAGAARCECDEGYIPKSESNAGVTCVEDTSCVKARILSCLWSGGSSITTHFSLSYCSGNPYVGLNIDDLLVDEKGNEDFEPLLPSESSATIMPHEFTEHVYVVLDISNSIKQSDVLDDIADGVRTLLDALVAQGGHYRFAVYLFDGKPYLYEFIPDTDDLAAAREALDNLAAQDGRDPSSSNVYGAVIEGIHTIDRARTLREQVSTYGLLTTGTLIVVSDGDDRSSTRTFAETEAAVSGTRSSVITVGLGDVADFPKLTSIGRDGSFSAGQPDQIAMAFGQIAERMNLTAQSLYFLGYCSPRRRGTFDVRIGVKGLEFERPSCTFLADGFVGACDKSDFIRAEACADIECGGLACGECPSGECCHYGECVAPGTLVEDDTCGLEWMCASEQTCSADKCKPTVAGGLGCGGEDLCNLQETYCGVPDPPPDPAPPPACLAAGEDGSTCKLGVHCKSLHCGVHPDRPSAASLVCLPPAKMYSPCGPQISCERGAYCDGTSCLPQKTGGGCVAHKECMSGNCVMLGSGAKACAGSAVCMFSHDL